MQKYVCAVTCNAALCLLILEKKHFLRLAKLDIERAKTLGQVFNFLCFYDRGDTLLQVWLEKSLSDI